MYTREKLHKKFSELNKVYYKNEIYYYIGMNHNCDALIIKENEKDCIDNRIEVDPIHLKLYLKE